MLLRVIDDDALEERVGDAEQEIVDDKLADGVADADGVRDEEGLLVEVSCVTLLGTDDVTVSVAVDVAAGVMVAVSVGVEVGGTLAVEEALAVQLRFSPA